MAPVELLMALSDQVLAGPASVALADEKVAPGKAPSVMVALPVKDRDQMKGMLGLLEAQLKARQREITTREYEGATITTVTVPDPKVGRPSYTLLDDRLLVASTPEWLEKALARRQAERRGCPPRRASRGCATGSPPSRPAPPGSGSTPSACRHAPWKGLKRQRPLPPR